MNISESQSRLSSQDRQRLGAAVVLGSAWTWYDFLVFGVVGAYVFGQLFFPTMSQNAARGWVFAYLALGLLARPVGAFVFGAIGDRLGRRSALISSLIIGAVGLALMGVLPTYSTIGVYAPGALLILRLATGVALGGAWAGLVVLSVEADTGDRTGSFATLPQYGAPLGIIGAAVVVAFFLLLPASATINWAWRIPFFLGLPALGVAWYLRFRVAEPDVAARARAVGTDTSGPAAGQTVGWLLGAATSLSASGLFYLLTIFCLHYGTNNPGMPPVLLLGGAVLSAIILLVGIYVGALLMEQLAPWRIVALGNALAAATCAVILCIFPFASSYWDVLLFAVAIGALGLAYAALGIALVNAMPSTSRYRSTALAYNVAGLVGGLLPLWVFAQDVDEAFVGMLGITGALFVFTSVSAVGALRFGFSLRSDRVPDTSSSS